MIGNHYCFAILDWGYESSSRRVWLTTNLPYYGVDQDTRCTAELLENLPLQAILEMQQHLNAARVGVADAS